MIPTRNNPPQNRDLTGRFDCANDIENGVFCSTPGVFPIRNQYELIKNYQLMVVYADAEKFPKLSVIGV